MKQTSQNIIKVIAGVSAFLTLYGTTALADPRNSFFLQVDIDGGGGATQAGFLSWPVPDVAVNNYSWTQTTNFAPSSWAYSNQYTPTGTVTVTILAVNNEANIATNVNTPFPTWAGDVQYSPNGINRASMSGETWANLYNDFLVVSHDTHVGYGEDYISLSVSNLTPNTNYEVTVWDYDEYVSDGSPGYYVAWGPQNPDPYGTNNFQPGQDTMPRVVRVPDGGPWPSQVNVNDQEFVYSGSFFVTTDPNGSFTMYAWEDDNTYGTEQWVPFNGFAIGFATNYVNGPSTNAFTNIVVNPPLAAYGPPTVWPYFAGLNIAGTNYQDVPFKGTNIIGQTFIPQRDFMLRNFYIACRASTNTGIYILSLYDVGVTNMAQSGQYGEFYINDPFNTNGPTTNLLAHPNSYLPLVYWTWAPTNYNITNTSIVKFKLPQTSDQVYLTNGHSYFLGLQFVPGSGSNNLVWEGTSSNAYTNGTAFMYVATVSDQYYMLNMNRNLIMACDVLNPNPQITVTTYPLPDNYPTPNTWPTLAGMTNGGNPVITVDCGPAGTGADPGYLDFFAPGAPAGAFVTVGLGEGNTCQSMSFYNQTNFNLGAVAVVMHGVGSSNCLFTLNVFQVTNTIFTATDSIEHWPRNFQPNLDTQPLSTPIWGTNLDFYYPTNLNGGGNGTTDQILVLTLPSNYQAQATIQGTNASPYSSYVVELCADEVGQNASAVGLFMIERDSADSTWQAGLFQNTGSGAGYTNVPATNSQVLVEPESLATSYPDPERYRGGVVGAGQPRQVVMALYAAPPPAPSTADMGLGKVGPASVFALSNMTYTISVTNLGPASASGVVVTDTLPAGVTFVSACCGGVNNSGVVTWSLGAMTNGQVTNLTVTVTAPASGSLTNVASVGSSTSDTNLANNVAQVITSVTPVADMGLGKVGPASVFALGSVTYTISVTNLGPDSASGVVVTDTLPVGVTFVSASGGGVNNSGVVTWSLGTLANGQVSTLTVTVTAPATSGSLTNVALVSSSTSDLNLANNTAQVVTTVTPLVAPAGVGATRSGGNVNVSWTVNPGQTYSVLRTNILVAPKITWPVIASNLTSSPYTDPNPTGAINFYIIRSP
jgi:uncharacterized repeat protein (TIGR01451 family)